MEEDRIEEIRQNGKTLFKSSCCGGVVFKNMTGENFKKDPEGYRQYKMYLKSQGVDLKSPIEYYENGIFVKTGKIKLFANES